MARTLTPAQKALQHEYSTLRKKAEARRKRLEAAGFTGYQAKKVKDIEPKNLKRELGKLRRAMDKATATVKGARAQQAARDRRDRGRPPTRQEACVKPQRSEKEEQRRQRHNEANRRYRERAKARERALQEWLRAADAARPGVGQALRNLKKGLEKYHVKVRTPEELSAWGQYIKERKNDSLQDFYEFDLWIDDMQKATGRATKVNVTAADVMNVLLDFDSWKVEHEKLQKEFNKSRSPNEYYGDEFGTLWRIYMKTKDLV